MSKAQFREVPLQGARADFQMPRHQLQGGVSGRQQTSYDTANFKNLSY